MDGEKIEIKVAAVSSKEEDPVKRDYEIKKVKAKSVINQSLDYLVSHVYSDLALIVETLIDYISVGKCIPGTKDVPIEIHWNF